MKLSLTAKRKAVKSVYQDAMARTSKGKVMKTTVELSEDLNRLAKAEAALAGINSESWWRRVCVW
jgi:hypothetical protein